MWLPLGWLTQQTMTMHWQSGPCAKEEKSSEERAMAQFEQPCTDNTLGFGNPAVCVRARVLPKTFVGLKEFSTG